MKKLEVVSAEKYRENIDETALDDEPVLYTDNEQERVAFMRVLQELYSFKN